MIKCFASGSRADGWKDVQFGSRLQDRPPRRRGGRREEAHVLRLPPLGARQRHHVLRQIRRVSYPGYTRQGGLSAQGWPHFQVGPYPEYMEKKSK